MTQESVKQFSNFEQCAQDSHINMRQELRHLYVRRHMNGLLRSTWFNSKSRTWFHESTQKLIIVPASSPVISPLLLFYFQASSPQTDSVHSWDTETCRWAVPPPPSSSSGAQSLNHYPQTRLVMWFSSLSQTQTGCWLTATCSAETGW